MSGVGNVMNGDTRKQLEQRADAARSRLEQKLEVLDERRERIASVARAVTRSPWTPVVVGAAGLTATILIVRRVRRRPSGLERLERILGGLPAAAPRPEGLLMKAFKRAAVSLLVGTVQRLSTRSIDRLLGDAAQAPHTVNPPRAQ